MILLAACAMCHVHVSVAVSAQVLMQSERALEGRLLDIEKSFDGDARTCSGK